MNQKPNIQMATESVGKQYKLFINHTVHIDPVSSLCNLMSHRALGNVNVIKVGMFCAVAKSKAGLLKIKAGLLKNAASVIARNSME